MGKKTNWTVTEDQTLCRAWLNASETVLPQSSDQKASTFWNVVYHLFHAELDTAVERPHNGLKIRWTRINRDVQKFALIFAQVQTLAAEIKASTRATATAAGGALSDTNDGAETEQQCIEDAKEQFYKEHDTKFLFEACWKLLRYSPKWIQLLANSTGASVPSSGSSTAAAAAAAAAAHHFLNVDAMPRIDEVAHATQASEPAGGTSSSANKRRASALLEAYGRGPIQQLQDVTGTLVDEMRRRNELLEEQNAIALFRLETDIIEDDDARECFELLRRRYVKKMRAAMQPPSQMVSSASSTNSGNDNVPGLNDALAESAAAAAGETLSEGDDEERKHGDKQLVHGDIV